MGIVKTEFEGLYIFEPKVFEDERGYFFESFNANLWKETGINTQFVQDNESKSQYGTIRGLHYQISPFQQAKLVRVSKGKVLDVVVDLRKEQPTYGKSFGVRLSSKNRRQLYIPRGFAHGFSTLSKTAVFTYKCDNFYSKKDEFNINPMDRTLNIDWGIKKKDIILSQRDTNGPLWGKHRDYE